MATELERAAELTAETALEMYERMALIRAFEEATVQNFADALIPGSCTSTSARKPWRSGCALT